MITGIYGVNVAVKDLAEATKRYESFFEVKAKPLGPESFAFPDLLGSQLEVNGFHITLIASQKEGTSVGNFLEKRGEGLFLLSVEVDDIENDATTLRERGAALLLNDNVAGEFGAVNFVHPKSMAGVQLEIFQPSSSQSTPVSA